MNGNNDIEGASEPVGKTLWSIFAIVVFTLLCYIEIGLQMAVVPLFVKEQLGFSSAIAGFAVSVQYLATFVSRIGAGHRIDTRGPKKVVIAGLFLGSSALFVMGILYLGSGTGKSRKSFTFMDIPQCHAFGLLIFPVPSSFVVLLHWTTEWRSKSVCESGVQCVRTVSARHDAFTVSIRENSRIFHGRAVQPR